MNEAFLEMDMIEARYSGWGIDFCVPCREVGEEAIGTEFSETLDDNEGGWLCEDCVANQGERERKRDKT